MSTRLKRGSGLLGSLVAVAALLASPLTSATPANRPEEQWGPDALDAADHDRIPCAKCLRDALSWDDRASCKIDPTLAAEQTCAPPPPGVTDEAGDRLETLWRLFPLEEERHEKRVRVAAMVRQALEDQVKLLDGRKKALERWDPRERAHFVKWFGTTDRRAQALVYGRIKAVKKINARYSVRNFRRAFPSRPGVVAYVHGNDPSRIFIDREFIKAPGRGYSSKAGTLVHEMSHFRIAGGTVDHVYGPRKCKALARRSPRMALNNADNFEFYVEGTR